MDLAKARPDRFCPILPICAEQGVLRVRAGSQIPRTRADFERFSVMSGNRGTETPPAVQYNTERRDGRMLPDRTALKNQIHLDRRRRATIRQ